MRATCTERAIADASSADDAESRRVAPNASGSAHYLHDLRNLLSLISGHAGLIRLLETAPDTLASAEAIQRAASDAGIMLVRLQSLLTMTESQALAESIKLADLVDEALSYVRGLGLPAAVALSARVPADLYVYGLAYDLRRMLLNLLKNAIEAMPEGGTIELQARLQRAPREAGILGGERAIALSIRDSGAGMTPELLRALERGQTTTKPNGSGLGLLSSREIARTHGGSILLESVCGHGTTVTVWLPQHHEQSA